MNKSEMKIAVSLAKSGQALMDQATGIFDGFGLPDFAPVHVTLRQVAWLIRWQAGMIVGRVGQPAWDAQEIDDIAYVGRTKFIIIGI